MSTTTTIHDHIVEKFAPDVSEIPADYDLIAGAVVDSLGLVRLLAWISERFQINVEDIDLDPASFRTLADMSAFVDQHAQTPSGLADLGK